MVEVVVEHMAILLLQAVLLQVLIPMLAVLEVVGQALEAVVAVVALRESAVMEQLVRVVATVVQEN
jgi:hypothetical protein